MRSGSPRAALVGALAAVLLAFGAPSAALAEETAPSPSEEEIVPDAEEIVSDAEEIVPDTEQESAQETPSEAADDAEPRAFADSTLLVAPLTIAPGGQVHITGECYADLSAGFTYETFPFTTWDDSIRFDSAVPVNPDGSVDAWLRLPASAPPGQYSLGLTCIDLDAVYDSASFELTVTGAVPTERPKKVADFSVTPLEGAPGDPLRVTGQCLVNGVPGDRVTATWIYPTDFVVADSRVILALPVAPDGTVDGTVVVPDDARPWLHGPFSNAISLRCESEGMAFGSKTFDFSLDGDDPPTPEPPAEVVSSFSFDRTSIRPGDTVAFDATCTIDGEPLVFLSFFFERNGSSIPVHEFFEPDSQGRLSGSFTVPYMRPGKVLLETACPGAGPFEFTVLEPRSSTPPPTEPPGPNDDTDNASTANDNGAAASLASTGAPPRGAWLASAAIALLGGAALLLTRRKTERS